MSHRPLAGRRVVVTRPERGSLAAALADAGALIEHVPLIAIAAPRDGGRALRAALDQLAGFDWLVVTSTNGAGAVGAAAVAHPSVRLAAVGAATAARLAELAGRPVDVVPRRQRVAGLLEELPAGTGRVLVAQADRAQPALCDGLRARGYEVTAVEAYRTVLRPPSAAEAVTLATADAVVLASGSAVESWLSTGVTTADIAAAIVTIGPPTAEVARRMGLSVAAVAVTPADADVVTAVATALGGDLGA